MLVGLDAVAMERIAYKHRLCLRKAGQTDCMLLLWMFTVHEHAAHEPGQEIGFDRARPGQPQLHAVECILQTPAAATGTALIHAAWARLSSR